MITGAETVCSFLVLQHGSRPFLIFYGHTRRVASTVLNTDTRIKGIYTAILLVAAPAAGREKERKAIVEI
jgi:hypothetical protein